jgi:hypothetical protein
MAYWLLSLTLIVFGFLTGFSIGQPFLLIGLALLALGPFRKRPRVFWPPFLAVVAYDVAYWALVPFSCTATQAVGAASSTVCTNLLGARFEGTGVYNPSPMPATLAALACSSIVLVGTFAVMTWRRHAPAAPSQ